MKSEDHDVLIRIEENLNNFLNIFKNHVDDNDQMFKEVHEKFETITHDLDWMKRYLWMGLGIISVVVFLANFIKR